MALAIVLRLLLDPWRGGQFPFHTLFFAIMLTAWCGGFRRALTATCLGGIGADYFLLAPLGNFRLERMDLPGLLFYLVTGIGIAGLGGLMHQARKRAETSAAALQNLGEQLELRVLERTAELQQH